MCACNVIYLPSLLQCTWLLQEALYMVMLMLILPCGKATWPWKRHILPHHFLEKAHENVRAFNKLDLHQFLKIIWQMQRKARSKRQLEKCWIFDRSVFQDGYCKKVRKAGQRPDSGKRPEIRAQVHSQIQSARKCQKYFQKKCVGFRINWALQARSQRTP